MIRVAAAAVIIFFSITSDTVADLIATVPVGYPGNAGKVVDLPDARWYMSGTFGDVAYHYRIGETLVTNDQYVAFLNSIAATDPFRLYHQPMTTDPRGGILRSGSSGDYSYSSKTNMGNKPVNYVTFWDAARFTNWLHNGMPSGLQDLTSTEDGAYRLNNQISTITNPENTSVTRNPDAVWFIPSEDEWYKAAYHANNGITGGYFDFPTAHNEIPEMAIANSVGDVANPGPNVANWGGRADWNGLNGNVTTVGSAGSPSAYGTFDQGGLLDEWTDTILDFEESFNCCRIVRGGSWGEPWQNLHAVGEPGGSRDVGGPNGWNHRIGFRVATEADVLAPDEVHADFDQDGDVDGDDFIAWQSGFGTESGATKSDGDYDNDADVDGDDFLGWQAEFGLGNGAASAAVPEPTSIVLLIVVGAVFLSRQY